MQIFHKGFCLLLALVLFSGCFDTQPGKNIEFNSGGIHHEASYEDENVFLNSLPTDSYFLGYDNTNGLNTQIDSYLRETMEYMIKNGFSEDDFPVEEQDEMKSYLKKVQKARFLFSITGDDLKKANLPEPLEEIGMLASLNNRQSKDIVDFFIDQTCFAGFLELENTPENIEIIKTVRDEEVLQSILSSAPLEINPLLSMKYFNIEIKSASDTSIYFEALNCEKNTEKIVIQPLPNEAMFVKINTFSFYKYAKNFSQWKDQYDTYKKIGLDLLQIGATQISSEPDDIKMAMMLIDGLESQVLGLNNLLIGMDIKRSGIFWKIKDDALFITSIISLFSGDKKQILSNYYQSKGLSAEYSLHQDIDYSYNIEENNNTIYFQHRYGNIDSFFFVRRIFVEYLALYGDVSVVIVPALIGVSILTLIEELGSNIETFDEDIIRNDDNAGINDPFGKDRFPDSVGANDVSLRDAFIPYRVEENNMQSQKTPLELAKTAGVVPQEITIEILEDSLLTLAADQLAAQSGDVSPELSGRILQNSLIMASAEKQGLRTLSESQKIVQDEMARLIEESL